jgi:hypothetical protein
VSHYCKEHQHCKCRVFHRPNADHMKIQKFSCDIGPLMAVFCYLRPEILRTQEDCEGSFVMLRSWLYLRKRVARHRVRVQLVCLKTLLWGAETGNSFLMASSSSGTK